MDERRGFLLKLAKGVGLSAMGGLIWSGYLNEAKSSPLILRPPSALNEDDFLKQCIRCGMCVQACPYDTLLLAKAGDNKPIGMPYFEPRKIPCYMCEDIPCVPPCPSGALDKSLVDINKSKMGMAVVDSKSCIAFWGIQCDACYRACPLLDKALVLEYKRNERTGKHAFLMPIVDSEYCTGCGMCEHACVTKKPAIFILPRVIAMGEVGDRYIKGWDKSDEVKLQNISTDVTTHTDISNRDTKSYLDSEDLLYE